MKTLIRNGHVVTAVDSYIADILIDGATVAVIGKDLDKIAGALDKTVDATNKLVIPGGIDPHTHMDLPFGGTSSSDDFESGTRAASIIALTPEALQSFAASPASPSEISMAACAYWRSGNVSAVRADGR